MHPSLIPLLRQPAGDGILRKERPVLLERDPVRHALAPARGIALGVALSLPFWGLVSLVSLVFRR